MSPGGARQVISTCPICEHELSVTRLHCGECGTTLEGAFSVGRFGRLDRDQLALLESFLRARGNLREMERELGLSYPTLRNRIEAVVRALGLADDRPEAEADRTASGPTGPGAPRPTDAPGPATMTQRRELLQRLARGELSAEDAAAALRRLTGSSTSSGAGDTEGGAA